MGSICNLIAKLSWVCRCHVLEFCHTICKTRLPAWTPFQLSATGARQLHPNLAMKPSNCLCFSETSVCQDFSIALHSDISAFLAPSCFPNSLFKIPGIKAPQSVKQIKKAVAVQEKTKVVGFFPSVPLTSLTSDWFKHWLHFSWKRNSLIWNTVMEQQFCWV